MERCSVYTLRIEPCSPNRASSWKIDLPGSILTCPDFPRILKLLIFLYFANIFTYNLYYYGLWVIKKIGTTKEKHCRKLDFYFNFLKFLSDGT